MEKPVIKIYFLVFIFLIFFLILIVLFPINKKKENSNPSSHLNLKPTSVKVLPTQTKKISIPTDLVMPTFTGGGDQEPPKEEIELSLSVQKLRAKTPLIENNFMITYDYREDKFIVSLKENNEIIKQEFEKWRQENFPNIPKDEFIFQD